MSDGFEQLTNPDEVISVDSRYRFIANIDMFKVGQLAQESKKRLLYAHQQSAWDGWAGEGVPCEILQLGAKGWRKGKVRMRIELEFCPDEPESPLDDIRQITP